MTTRRSFLGLFGGAVAAGPKIGAELVGNLSKLPKANAAITGMLDIDKFTPTKWKLMEKPFSKSTSISWDLRRRIENKITNLAKLKVIQKFGIQPNTMNIIKYTAKQFAIDKVAPNVDCLKSVSRVNKIRMTERYYINLGIQSEIDKFLVSERSNRYNDLIDKFKFKLLKTNYTNEPSLYMNETGGSDISGPDNAASIY